MTTVILFCNNNMNNNMAALNRVPTEVLHGILSHLSGDFTDLRNCSLVCHALWDVASSALYRHVDLNFDEQYDREAKEKTERRQLRLLQSLADNPKLGAMVLSFKNHRFSAFPRSPDDATFNGDTSMIIRAAENMRRLSSAFLTSNPLAAHIIANLTSYPELHHLHVFGLQPGNHIWDMAPVSLKTLKWEESVDWRRGGLEHNAWEVVQFLLKVVEVTCPNLESIEVSAGYIRRSLFSQHLVPLERSEQYWQVDASPSVKLTKLQHFGFYFDDYSSDISVIEAPFLNFIEKHGLSLKSISIPIRYASWTREELEFIRKVCGWIPNLKVLSLVPTHSGRQGNMMSPYDFFNALTNDLASPKFSIDQFSVMDIGVPFSSAMGKLFRSWTSLKFLQLGDANNNRTHSPYGYDGRPDFRSYSPAILGFIKSLPPSLRELYIEINGEGLCCDDDSDFDPMCNLGTPIFDALRRLHTCDIHAWISDIGGGLKRIPEKAVFYRRLMHEPSADDDAVPANRIKDVWTSRMDCIYQDTNRNVSTECVEVELEDHEGVFEGEDADGVWCDGFEFQLVREGIDSERPPRGPDRSWPRLEDKVGSYAMFRKRQWM